MMDKKLDRQIDQLEKYGINLEVKHTRIKKI